MSEEEQNKAEQPEKRTKPLLKRKKKKNKVS